MPGAAAQNRRQRALDAAAVGVPTVLHLLQVRSGPSLTEQPGGAVAVAVLVLAVLQGLPLARRRRHPIPVAGACLTATLVSALLVPVPPYAAVVAVHGVAAYDRGARWRTGAVGAAAVGVLAVAAARWGPLASWVPTAALVLAVALLAGALSRVRRAELQALQDRADALERERDSAAARAVAEERLRVARDLHDLVGHGLSAIAVQAGTARVALRLGAVAEASEAVSAVEAVTRESLAEMRQVLGDLRSSEAPPPPAPGLRDLGTLVAHTAAAGCAVATTVDGEVQALPASVSLAAYRIVQEALTNVVKHAPGAEVRLQVHARPDAVHLLVEDTPTGPVPAAAVPAPRTGGGHGLVGMRERAAALGGELEAGPAEPAGWRVAARLPVLPAQGPA